MQTLTGLSIPLNLMLFGPIICRNWVNSEIFTIAHNFYNVHQQPKVLCSYLKKEDLSTENQFNYKETVSKMQFYNSCFGDTEMIVLEFLYSIVFYTEFKSKLEIHSSGC